MKWIERIYYRPSTKAYDLTMYVCSECGYEHSYDAETGISEYKYCPNCGSKEEIKNNFKEKKYESTENK